MNRDDPLRASPSVPLPTVAVMAYSFVGKSADQIIKDLEANEPQAEIGARAYELAAAALQADALILLHGGHDAAGS